MKGFRDPKPMNGSCVISFIGQRRGSEEDKTDHHSHPCKEVECGEKFCHSIEGDRLAASG